jgi:hypothetical protein
MAGAYSFASPITCSAFETRLFAVGELQRESVLILTERSLCRWRRRAAILVVCRFRFAPTRRSYRSRHWWQVAGRHFAHAGRGDRVRVLRLHALYGCGAEAVLYGLLLMLGIPIYVWQRREHASLAAGA